jgi:hypothetical protein
MVRKNFIAFIVPLVLLLAGPGRGETLLEQCRDYFSFNDYEKAVETANRALLSPEYRKDPDLTAELLYYINEAGEELAEQVQERINAVNEAGIRQECLRLKKELKLTIDIESDGFYYVVRYRHEALDKLIKIDPKNEYIEMIKLKRLLRQSRLSLDPVYRFQHDRKLLDLYQSYISNYPGSRFRPNLMMKTADICFHLYETGSQYKAQLDLTDREIEEYYRQSREIYKSVMRSYPDSEASRYVGEIRMNNVKLRKEPTTKSTIIRVLPTGALVRVVDRSEERFRISNTWEYWYKIRLADGVEGWIYGIYLNTTFQ